MKRRTLVAGAGAAALARFVPSRAQRPARRIGWLSADRPENNSGYAEFLAGLRSAGHRVGDDLVVDARWGMGSLEQSEQLAADLVASQPALIVTQGPVVRYVRKTGTTLPVVFGFSGDPVAAGIVDSFARPGRNYTGVSFFALDLVGKRFELLREAVPQMRRVACLANPDHPGESAELKVSREAAERMRVDVAYFPVRSRAEFDAALAGAAQARSEAIVLFPDAGMMRYAEDIAAFGTRQRIPAISGWSIFARRGNVMSYGPSLDQGYRRLAYYVDRVLKGARPGDIPVELPTRVELTLNLKAAKAIALALPASMIVRADEVIPA
jgi:putative ABC transport system substrate-binding protein